MALSGPPNASDNLRTRPNSSSETCNNIFEGIFARTTNHILHRTPPLLPQETTQTHLENAIGHPDLVLGYPSK